MVAEPARPSLLKFSERARRVLQFALEESQRFGHFHIGTEHLLLGLVRETGGEAVRILADLGIELTRVQSAVEFTISTGEGPYANEIGFTPQLNKIIQLAVAEARALKHNYIGTAHLLVGVMCEGEGVGAGVLGSLGVTPERLRESHKRVFELEQSSISDLR